MLHRIFLKCAKRRQILIFLCILLFPLTLHASFIEATIGTAVINDATATYHNPAALTLLNNTQVVALGSVANFRTSFTGQSIQTSTGFTQTGTANANTTYYLPSLYWGKPATDKITVGLAVISNFFTSDSDDDSILRYVKSSNNVQDIDVVPAIGVKLTDFVSLGAGISFSYANLLLQPTSGFPSLNVPDSQSRNECNGTGVGGDVGILLRPSASTLVGFNYHSAVSYQLSGTSVLEGNPQVNSNQYHFTFWTPARSVLTVSHFVTSALGFIATVQRIQWSVFNNINVHGVATQVGSQPAIVNAIIPYHMRDTWLLTLGSQYRMIPKCVIRAAGSYVQSPGNGSYQLANGNSFVLGASVGYTVNKNILIDGSYAHAFMQNKSIHIQTSTNRVNGINQGSRDAVSLKLTFNFV